MKMLLPAIFPNERFNTLVRSGEGVVGTAPSELPSARFSVVFSGILIPMLSI
jgi:hypothetical protein